MRKTEVARSRMRIFVRHAREFVVTDVFSLVLRRVSSDHVEDDFVIESSEPMKGGQHLQLNILAN